MKFAGTCLVCNEKIEVNEIGLWAKGEGVKHEKCAKINELKCIVCGGPAGCTKCEFREDCIPAGLDGDVINEHLFAAGRQDRIMTAFSDI